MDVLGCVSVSKKAAVNLIKAAVNLIKTAVNLMAMSERTLDGYYHPGLPRR